MSGLPEFGLGYFLISVVFILLGGAVAVILGSPHPGNALFVGVTLPIIVSSMLQIPPQDLVNRDTLDAVSSSPAEQEKKGRTLGTQGTDNEVQEFLDTLKASLQSSVVLSAEEKQRFWELVRSVSEQHDSLVLPESVDRSAADAQMWSPAGPSERSAPSDSEAWLLLRGSSIRLTPGLYESVCSDTPRLVISWSTERESVIRLQRSLDGWSSLDTSAVRVAFVLTDGITSLQVDTIPIHFELTMRASVLRRVSMKNFWEKFKMYCSALFWH